MCGSAGANVQAIDNIVFYPTTSRQDDHTLQAAKVYDYAFLYTTLCTFVYYTVHLCILHIFVHYTVHPGRSG